MIAFLGLGRMGAPMAGRLAAAGRDVTAWNRTPGRLVPGIRIADSIAEALAEADLVISMLSDPDAVAQVFAEAVPALRPGTLVVEMSTIGPEAVVRLRDALPANVGLVDAPVRGSLPEVAAGRLDIYLGGSEADVARCRDTVAVLGDVSHVGALGAGAALKLAVMGTLVSLPVLIGETLAGARKWELDREVVLDALSRTYLGPLVQRIRSADGMTRFALSLAAKDLALATNPCMSLAAAAHGRLRDAQRAGLGRRDLLEIVPFAESSGASMRKINPPSVPPPAGAYSHAARTGDLLFVAGQVALDEVGKVIGEGDIVRQSEVVYDYLGRILADQGATFDDVVNVRTFLTDMSLLQEHGSVRRRHFTGEPPTSTTVEVSALFRPGLMLEVDVVARIP